MNDNLPVQVLRVKLARSDGLNSVVQKVNLKPIEGNFKLEKMHEFLKDSSLQSKVAKPVSMFLSLTCEQQQSYSTCCIDWRPLSFHGI